MTTAEPLGTQPGATGDSLPDASGAATAAGQKRLRFPWVSLILAGVVIALWARSYSHADYTVLFVPGGYAQGAASMNGRILVVLTNISLGRERGLTVDAGAVNPEQFREIWDLFYGSLPSRREAVGGFGVAAGAEGSVAATGSHVALVLPHWALLALLLVPHAASLVRRQTRLRRVRAGRCGHCGYDLRGSAARCPECGTAAGESPRRVTPVRFLVVAATAVLPLVGAGVVLSWLGPSEMDLSSDPVCLADTRLGLPLAAPLSVIPMPLDQVVDDLRKRTSVEIVVEWDAVARQGVRPGTLIDPALLRGDTAGHVLTTVVAGVQGPGGMGYVTHGNTAVVTTQEDLGRRAVVRCYDVRRLVRQEFPLYHPGWWGNEGSEAALDRAVRRIPGTPAQRAEELIELADAWLREYTATRGGYRGSFRCFDGWLVVVQDDKAHHVLYRWLAWLGSPEQSAFRERYWLRRRAYPEETPTTTPEAGAAAAERPAPPPPASPDAGTCQPTAKP